MTGLLTAALGGLMFDFFARGRLFSMSVALAVAWLYAARELFGLPVPLVERKWQVPARMVQGSLGRAGVIWGAALGSGLLTYVRFSSVLVLHAWILTAGSMRWGLAVGAAYGLFRSTLMLANPSFLRSSGNEAEPGRAIRLMARYTGLVRRVNGIVLGLVSLWWTRALTLV